MHRRRKRTATGCTFPANASSSKSPNDPLPSIAPRTLAIAAADGPPVLKPGKTNLTTAAAVVAVTAAVAAAVVTAAAAGDTAEAAVVVARVVPITNRGSRSRRLVGAGTAMAAVVVVLSLGKLRS